MNEDIRKLFISLRELRKLLIVSIDKAGEASELAEEISGEFDQEISTDMEELQDKLNRLLEDMDASYEEARTLLDDEDHLEKSLRDELDDEENYKTDSERVQEEIDEKEDRG